jgi:cutinase
VDVTVIAVRNVVGLVGAAVFGAAMLSAPVPVASAQEPCPDVEVVFARGTAEPPGVGGTGQAFVDALRARLGDRTLGVYPVNYPASTDFGNRIQFAQTVVDGIKDAGIRVQTTAANCPDTRIVLGGYSQGAVVAGYVTSPEVPAEVPAEYLDLMPKPMEPEVAENVAAVVLIGKPSSRFMLDIGAPTLTIGPLYQAKTLDLCAPGDTICDGAQGVGLPNFAHASYTVNGLMNQAADYVMGRL